MRSSLLVGGAACIALAATLAFAGNSEPAAALAGADPLLERGYYLVHKVGMCADCHSPRGPDGRFIEAQHLAGAPLPFVATIPMPWAPIAPNIAGLPAGYDDAALTRFLMTGERPNGLPPALPPMPEFRFSEEDAAAVTAYLASLAPASGDVADAR
jgi:cytochrome c553